MISSVQSNNESSFTQTGSSENGVMGKDDFLNLLVTQLKHQDPLNPMDSADFTAQLAQFSSLEQLENANTNLETLISAQTDMSSDQALSYIGKTVLAYGNIVNKTEGVMEDIQFELGENAEKVYIQIYDSEGNLVRNIEEGEMEMGTNSYSWDGLDSDGNEVDDGAYTFEVYGFDASEESIDTVWFIEAPITGVTYNSGKVYLNSGDTIISKDAIFKVQGS